MDSVALLERVAELSVKPLKSASILCLAFDSLRQFLFMAGWFSTKQAHFESNISY